MSESISPSTRSRSLLARQFFVLSSGLLTVSLLIAVTGIRWLSSVSADRSLMPIAFWISTAFLVTGSVTLQRAAWLVRVQQLPLFRRWLVISLIAGTLFVGVQICGLWRLAQNQTRPGQSLPDSAETGANALVAMFAGLHGVHFVIAMLFVAWITVNAFANRYDHEYSSGVTFCAWFWHSLGIVWLMILGLFAAGALTGFEAISVPDPQSTAAIRVRKSEGGSRNGDDSALVALFFRLPNSDFPHRDSVRYFSEKRSITLPTPILAHLSSTWRITPCDRDETF